MGTRFSWAYLIRCDATDYIYPSPTKPKNQVRTTPLPNVIRQHAARSRHWLFSTSSHLSDRLSPKGATRPPTLGIRPISYKSPIPFRHSLKENPVPTY